jgi:hypothetical protein
VTFETLAVREEGAVLFAEIAAPPMNLLGPELVRDLVSLIQRAEAGDAARVLVFTSADPDYFISHVDVTRISEYRAEAAKLTGDPSIALLFRHLSVSRLVTIAQIEGRVRGAGSEFVLACDMRFAARESAIFGQFEPAFGLLPGGGAAQPLARLMGPAGSIERCPPTSSATSSDRSPVGSPAFRPPGMPLSRTGSMRSRSRRPRTSVAIPISSVRAWAVPRRKAGSAPRSSAASRPETRKLLWRGCWATWLTVDLGRRLA